MTQTKEPSARLWMGNTSEVCPWCGRPLEVGELKSRGGNYFLPADEKVPLTYSASSLKKRKAISLSPSTISSIPYPAAVACRTCKKIIIPYEEIG